MPQPDSAAPPGGSLARSAIASLGMRAIDIPSRYGFHLLIAGKLGVAASGAFFIVFGVLTLAAGLGRLGIDRAMTREVAAALAHENSQAGNASGARRVILRGLGLIALLSTLAGAAAALAAQPLAQYVFADEALARPLLLAALVMPPLCLSAGTGGVLAGLHRIGASQMLYSWLWPALFCIGALLLDLTLDLSLWLLLASTTAAALLGLVLVWRALPEAAPGASAPPPAPLLPLGWALFTQEIATLVMAAAPALMLGVLATQEAVGVYAMAWRLALVLNLLVAALAAMAAPRFATAHARGDEAALRATATQTLGIVLALGAGPLVVLFVGAEWLLALFGEGFAAGAGTLRILLAGQLALMLATALPELLGMAGRERALRRFSQATLLGYLPVLAAGCYFLAETGAALATTAMALLTAAGCTLLCRRYFGFVPLTLLPQILRDLRRKYARRDSA